MDGPFINYKTFTQYIHQYIMTTMNNLFKLVIEDKRSLRRFKKICFAAKANSVQAAVK